MTLRQKAFIFISIICLTLIGAVFLVSRTIILDNFDSLEKQNTAQNLGQVSSAIDAKIKALDTFTQDYAGWDDTYNFIQNSNKEYIESNLVDETFAATGINLMAYINSEGTIVFSKIYDPELQQSVPLTNDFKKYIKPGDFLLQHSTTDSEKSGIILLNEDPMIVVSRPILTSEKKGPILGSLIMGKYLNKAEVDDLKKTTKLDVTLLRADNTIDDLDDKLINQLKTDKQLVFPLSSTVINGYKSISDINGNPAVFVKVKLGRPIYQQGNQAVFWLVGSLIVISILAAIISLLYIDKLILTPLRKLVKDVNTIRSNADFSIHVRETGEGELSALARDINKMTNALASGEKALRVVNKEIEFEKANVEKIVEERTQELKAEQARFIASINSVKEAFILLDTEQKVLITNHVVSHIFDTDHQDWPFDKIQLALKDSFNFAHAYKQCIERKESMSYDEVAHKDKVLRIYFAPVFLAPKTGTLTGIVVTIADITEAKKLERSKDEFFSIASHELRTPLTAIKGNTQMLQKYFAEKIQDKNFSDMLNDLYSSSIRLIEIVNIFLTTSRLEQGKIEFDVKPFNIVELASAIVERMQTTAQEKSLKLNLTPVSQEIIALADKNRTEEVILNLISNAINYTEKGSVTVSIQTQGREVKVSVEDTGRGISAQDQPLLFRKFQQINDTLYRRDVSHGTGLGLYISRLMIEAMKGKIYIERSEVYKGSVFTFTLPLVTTHTDKTI